MHTQHSHQLSGLMLVGAALLADAPLRAEPPTLERATLATLRHKREVQLVALTPDGKNLASADGEGNIHLWDLDKAREYAVLDPGDTQPVKYRRQLRAEILRDEALLEETDPSDRERLLLSHSIFQRQLQLKSCQVWDQLLFSADGKMLFAAEYTARKVHRWHTSGGHELVSFNACVPITLAPDGKRFAHQDGRMITVSNAVSGGPLHCLRLGGMDATSFGLAFLPEGRLAAGRSILVRHDLPEGPLTLREVYELESFKQAVDYVPMAASRDGRRVLAHCNDTLVTWEADTGRIIAAWDHPKLKTRTIESAADLVLLTRFTGEVLLLDLLNGQQLGSWENSCAALSPDGKKLAVGNKRGEVRVFDVGQLRPRPRPTALTEQDLQQLWAELAAEPPQAEKALLTLCNARGQVEPFLSSRLRPAAQVDKPQFSKWIADLASEQFATRERAAQALAASELQAATALEHALKDSPELEVRARLTKLLNDLHGPVRDSNKVRELRALAILEHVGSPEARRLLTKLAGGADTARLTRRAKAALGVFP